MTEPILKLPNFFKRFTLTTDVSDQRVDAILSQEYEGLDHPVAYFSRFFNKHEKNYSITEQECLTALKAMLHFHPYLLGQEFTLRSDYEPMNWMHNRKNPNQRLTR